MQNATTRRPNSRSSDRTHRKPEKIRWSTCQRTHPVPKWLTTNESTKTLHGTQKSWLHSTTTQQTRFIAANVFVEKQWT